MLNRLRTLLSQTDGGSALRRFFINTLFDATFMLLGIISGFRIDSDSNLKILIGTMLTSSVALGISSGVSSFEAESLERERTIAKLEELTLIDLQNTQIEESNKLMIFIIALVNFLTPIGVWGVSISPYLLSLLGVIDIQASTWISIIMAIITIFIAGIFISMTYINVNEKKKVISKGLRMALFGGITFLIARWIESLI